MHQDSLFHGEHLPLRVAYGQLFQHLPALHLSASCSRGRPEVSRDALLRAMIYRALRRFNTLTDLVQALRENASVLEAVGFDPLGPIPSVERFSDWLRSTDNNALQIIRIQLARFLVNEGACSGRILALDSCPLLSPVRENNLKTAVRDRFNKARFPRGDPTARLGVLASYARAESRKVIFFWGYRNHVIVDTETELPLWEQTEPADRKDGPLAIPLLQKLISMIPLKPEAVCADSAYDNEAFLKFIINDLHAQSVVAANPRHGSNPDFRVQSSVVLCPANLEMFRRGKMTPRRTGITYQQYSCPIHYDKIVQQKFLICPAAHPKFFKQKGCNYLLRITPNIRSQIPYGSDTFRQLYRKRTAVERAFSRLLTISMQDLPTRGLTSARNLCTIAHITVLLVALTAHRNHQSDHLAFVRSFVPRLLEGD
jgi:transposase